MADVPPTHQSYFFCDIRYSQAAIRDGHFSNLHTVALYDHWSFFCTNLHMDHLLDDPYLPTIKILQVYEHWVRNGGFYSQASIIQSDLVATEWRDIAETHLLDWHRDPRKPPGSHSRDIDKCLTCMLRKFAYQDPPPQKEKSTPLCLVMADAESVDPSCHISLCTADLI